VSTGTWYCVAVVCQAASARRAELSSSSSQRPVGRAHAAHCRLLSGAAHAEAGQTLASTLSARLLVNCMGGRPSDCRNSRATSNPRAAAGASAGALHLTTWFAASGLAVLQSWQLESEARGQPSAHLAAKTWQAPAWLGASSCLLIPPGAGRCLALPVGPIEARG
jgi:hypothetical protein